MALSLDAPQWSWFALPMASAVLALLTVLYCEGRSWPVSAARMGPFMAMDGRRTEKAPDWVQAGVLGF
jgi:hypothetical protein